MSTTIDTKRKAKSAFNGLMTTAEVRDLLRVSEPTLRRYYTTGVHGRRLRIIRVGGRIRIHPTDLADFMAPEGGEPQRPRTARMKPATLAYLKKHNML